MTVRLAGVWFAGMLALSMGCQQKARGPTLVLQQYGEALEQNDYKQAYAMMSEEFRAQHSRESFVKELGKSRKAVLDAAARLRGSKARMEIFAKLRYGPNDTMGLVYEDGAWKIATSPAELYARRSPREALHSFVRAYHAKRWDILLTYIPAEYRKGMSVDTVREQFRGDNKEEMRKLMKRITKHIDEPILIKGKEARMVYAERYEVIFRREKDGWKIADLD